MAADSGMDCKRPPCSWRASCTVQAASCRRQNRGAVKSRNRLPVTLEADGRTAVLSSLCRVGARVDSLGPIMLGAGTAGRLSGRGRAARYPARKNTRAAGLGSPSARMSTPGRKIGVLYYSHPPHARHDLPEHLQPFPSEGVLKDSEAGDVAARPRKTCNKTISDWIGDQGEHDRHPRRCSMERSPSLVCTYVISGLAE